MKVIQVLNTGKFSGAENVALGICEGLQERGVSCAYASRKGSIEEVAEKRKVKFIGLDDISVGEIRKMVKREKPDVVHAHDMYAGVKCAVALVGTGCRFVVTVHNNFSENRRISVKSVAFIIAMIRAWRVFWVSDNAMKGYVFEWLFRKKSEVLGNIANVRNVNNKEKCWDVVFVGRLDAVKNSLRFVGVVDKIKKIKPDVKVAIVGDGDLRIETENEISLLRLEDTITMFGFRSDAVDILATSRVMLMTSKNEGIPMVALESMAAGVPIVGTNVGGMKEVVNERWLCETDEELVDRVVDILNNGCDDYVWYKGMTKEEYFERLMRAYE